MISWDLYRYFLFVARSGSFGAAAREMGVSQPTVSRKINQLQDELSVRVFEQDERGAHLTPRGEALLSLCEAMERKSDAIQGAAQYASETAPVRIATTVGLAAWLSERLAREALSIPVRVITGIPLTDVMHFQADIALRMGHPGDDALFGRKAVSIASGIYGANAVTGMGAGRKDLSDLPLIESCGEIHDIPQARALRELFPTAQASLSTDSVAVQIAAAEAGLGIVAIPCFMADNRPGLVRVLRDEFECVIDGWLLIHPSLKKSRRVRSIYELILEGLENDRAFFEGRTITANGP